MSKAKTAKAVDDATLLAALLRDEPAAWRTLVADCGVHVRSAARKVVRRVAGHLPSDFAQDVEQHVLLKLLQNDKRALRAFDPQRASLRTYLSRIATNLALDELAAFMRCGPSVDLAEVLDREGVDDADPDEVSSGAETPRAIELDFWIGARRAEQKAARSTGGVS